MPSIKLQSSDGEVFPVDIDIAKQSVTIKQMLEDLDVKVCMTTRLVNSRLKRKYNGYKIKEQLYNS